MAAAHRRGTPHCVLLVVPQSKPAALVSHLYCVHLSCHPAAAPAPVLEELSAKGPCSCGGQHSSASCCYKLGMERQALCHNEHCALWQRQHTQRWVHALLCHIIACNTCCSPCYSLAWIQKMCSHEQQLSPPCCCCCRIPGALPGPVAILSTAEALARPLQMSTGQNMRATARHELTSLLTIEQDQVQCCLNSGANYQFE